MGNPRKISDKIATYYILWKTSTCILIACYELEFLRSVIETEINVDSVIYSNDGISTSDR